MSSYNLNFEVGLATMSPSTPRRGGVYGDNNCATVTFGLTDEAYKSLFPNEGVSVENPCKYFCIEVNDAIGAYDATELKEVESEQKTFDTQIATAWTSPGMASLRLVLIKQNAEGKELWRWHSVPAYVYFEDRDNGEKMVENSLYEWQTTLAKAQAAADAAAKFAADAETSKTNAGTALNSANESAAAAQGYFKMAEEKATVAQEEASRANHSATLAGVEKNEAAQHADHAEAAMDAAEKAKEASEKAALAAEDFKNNAETASGLAQSYSADAERFALQAVSAAKDAQEYLQCCGNALIGSAVGELVTLPDVSPVEHDIQVGVRRKNLFNKENLRHGTTNETTYYNLLDDGRIWVPKNASSGTVKLKTLAPELEVGKTYVLSYETTATSKYIYLSGSGTVWKCGQPHMITQEELDASFSMYTDTEVQSTSAYVTNFQIEEGAVATSYAPYIEDLTNIQLVAVGKNLVDNDKFKNTDCWIDCKTIGGSVNNGNYVLSLKSNTTYTLTWNYENEAPEYFYFCSYPKGQPLAYGEQKTEKYLCGVGEPTLTHTFTAEPTKDYVLFLGGYKTHLPNITYFQIEVGSAATDYEEYQGQVYVQGEPVTSIYPTTTITTDTEGTLVEVQYHRDINKAFESLVQAIISLGGNV